MNALAPDQTLEFGPALNIVYGNSAAGKSGFIRILKRGCRARGLEPTILGNVLSGDVSSQPSATIAFSADGRADEFTLEEETSGVALGLVSVFDTQCAAVYLTERLDVAFRPSGLDLFDKLSKACQAVRQRLDGERTELEGRRVSLPELPEGTQAHEWLSKLSDMTDLQEAKNLAEFSSDEKRRQSDLHTRLSDLQAEDPQTLAESLLLRASRAERLAEQCRGIDALLRADSLEELFRSAERVREAEQTSRELQRSALSQSLLAGTGSDLWRRLWEAARDFSIEHAYPTKHFPVADDTSRCVLCQQRLGPEAQQRLADFRKYVGSTIQRELELRRTEYQTRRDALAGLPLADASVSDLVDDLAVEESALAGSLREGLADAAARRARVEAVLDDGGAIPTDLQHWNLHAKEVQSCAARLHARSQALLQAGDEDIKGRIERELLEFQARETLGEHLDHIAQAVERKKRLLLYRECQGDTDTRPITLKSKDVTRRVVTDRLASAFRAEAITLGMQDPKVEMSEAGGVSGTLFHRLVLPGATDVSVEKVASEGEARVLSIASFFAELSTGPRASAIIFDDPVSSLDHLWRENVAKRLAKEANTRQVIVFTHDIVFLWGLVRAAEEYGVECKHQQLHRELGAPGVTSPDVPWIAMRVRDRIGALKDRWQRAEKLERTSTRESYEQEAIQIYGRLRETWERAVEEVLLGRIVERYRPSVQTKHIAALVDISEEDCKTLERGMTKCSRWLAGHDQSAADNSPVPGSDELKEDIDALDAWVSGITKRRRSTSGTAQ